MSKREIPLELLGLAGLSPFYGTTHAARGAMFLSQAPQAPVVSGSEPPRIITGMELRLAEHTFDVKFPKDCTILAVVRKYVQGFGNDSIKHNPLITIVYEEFYDSHKTIGVIHVPEYMQFHQEFGYPVEKNPEVFSRLVPGENFEGGVPLVYSKASGKDSGIYGIGVNANVIFKSSPGTIEDGFIFSKEFLEEKMTPNTYTSVVGSAGMRNFFLNLYGDDKVYKPFPDIGEKIRSDGVVFATRTLDDDLSPAEMTPRALRDFDHTFDTGVIGEPGSIIKDISVYWDERQNPSHTPMGMDGQLRKYYDALKVYYSEILKLYRTFQGNRRNNLKITPEFNQLVVEALTFLPQKSELRKLTRTYRLDRLDEWRVELTYETKRIPSNAWKLTDNHGGVKLH